VRYLFYPGCSAEASALEYKASTLAVLGALGAQVEELDDWTCCGASAAPVVSELLGLVLPARNLALAEQKNDGGDVLAVCSACYTNLRRVGVAASDSTLLARINRALEVEGLTYRGTAQTRHLMDILANDFGPEAIAARVRRPLKGLTVAPYYGCQTVRPYSPFDNDQRPNSMTGVLEALGASVHRHSHEALCCGTSLLMTKPDVGLPMAAAILEAASQADCIAAVCPMCHMNLDGYQDRASRELGKDVSIPVLYLPQLMGLAFGLPQDALMLHRHVVPVQPVLARLFEAEMSQG
jgi:heterodisulfide reductase subunit B